MRPLLIAFLCLALTLSGCFGQSPSAGTDEDDTPAVGAEPGPGQRRVPEPNADPGVASGPRWQTGDWWKWQVDGRGFDTFELTTVVARATDDGYHIGVTELAPSLHAHILHVPPVGPVGLPGLEWYAHGENVALIDFPLHDGKTWTGALEGRALEFTAVTEERDGHTVFVVDSTYTDFDGQGPRYVYDPSIGMFSEVHLHYGGSVAFSSARVIDSGTGHTGDVRLPTARDKFLDGTGGATAILSPAGGFTAPAEKVWLVFACYLGGDTGSYGITYLTPSPSEDPLRCAMRNESPDRASDVQVLWRASVPGDWQIVFDVVGNGYAEAEVIGVVEELCALGNGSDQVETC